MLSLIEQSLVCAFICFFPKYCSKPFFSFKMLSDKSTPERMTRGKTSKSHARKFKKQASHADACLCSNSSLEISNDNETLELCSLYSTLLFWKFQHTGAFTTHCMICFSCLLHYLFIWPSEHLQTTLSILCKNNSSKNHSWANIFESGLPSTNILY